jgi:chromosome segregation ATPase
MSLDGLPAQLEAFLERARVVLHREIEEARAAVKALTSEKTKTQAVLAELREQHKQAQSQLDAVVSELQRRSTLAGINREIAGARKTLERLMGETAEAEKALEVLNKQRADGERRLVELTNEANRMIGIRTEGEAVMADIKAKLAQVQIGR